MEYGVRGNPNAKILVVGECWTFSDEKAGTSFKGSSGKELEKMLAEAGVNINDCCFTNVINTRPPGGEMYRYFYSNKEVKQLHPVNIRGLYPGAEILHGIESLDATIEQVKPDLIIALGEYALWALTEDDFKITNKNGYKQPTGMVAYRGSMLRSSFNNTPLLPTYHPISVMRKSDWRSQVVHDFRARIPKAFNGTWDEPEKEFIIEPSFETAMEYMNEIIMRAELSAHPLLLACDIETNNRHLECVGFADSVERAICIPIMCNKKWEGYWSPREEVEIILTMKRLLEHPKIQVAGQNFLYDYQYFWFYYTIATNYMQDTMLAHHCVYPGTPMGLSYISSMYCEHHRYWKDDGKEAAKNQDDHQRWIYNCRDCVVTFESMLGLWELHKYFGLQENYAIQMKRARAALQMMTKGAKVDERYRGQERIKHIEISQEYENKFRRIMPASVIPKSTGKAEWFNSPAQLCKILYDELGVKEIRSRKTGNPTVDDEALKKIMVMDPMLKPLMQALIEYRSLKVFGDFLNMRVNQEGRMSTTFSPTTETFRYRSSSDVFGYGRNLQNIPSGSED